MTNPESGKMGTVSSAETLEDRRHRLAYMYMELRTAIFDLIQSGTAEDGRTKTPELRHVEELGEQMKGEPIRGFLHGNRYHLDRVPAGWVSAPQYLPPRFEKPLVLGIFEGAVKMHKVQKHPELMIGVSPFQLSEREDIQEHYLKNRQAQNRWRQPMGLRNQDLDRRLWLPAVDFKFVPGYRDDDYLGAQLSLDEGFRAYFRHRLPPEQTSADPCVDYNIYG